MRKLLKKSEARSKMKIYQHGMELKALFRCAKQHYVVLPNIFVIQPGTFVPKIIEQVLSGSHQFTVVTSMLMTGEALSRLQREAFLYHQDNKQKHSCSCLSI